MIYNQEILVDNGESVCQENMLLTVNITDPIRKKAMLLHYDEEDVDKIFETLEIQQAESYFGKQKGRYWAQLGTLLTATRQQRQENTL